MSLLRHYCAAKREGDRDGSGLKGCGLGHVIELDFQVTSMYYQVGR
jgi:hypothetical protein